MSLYNRGHDAIYSEVFMTQIKVILELIKMLIEGWKWLSGEIDDLTYRRAINRRSKLREAYLTGDEIEKLKALRDLGQ